ncbi:MAG: hypothetical protein WA510_15490 [Acidobacteriaceae bacterium]
MTGTVPNCAVVFKAYSWDPFVERQAQRLAEASGGMDFYVSLDETGGSAGPIPFERVIRFTSADLETTGLAMRSPAGGVLWWNPDYAHYQFLEQCPNYDYYLFVEYDCVVPSALEQFVIGAASRGADLVALPMFSDFHKWHWTPYQRNVYPLNEVSRALLCVSLYSSRALHLLYQRRLAMSSDPSVVEWPNSELFVPTEVQRAGMTWLPIEEFGDASRYVWFPPKLEEDVPAVNDSFLHPVLDRRRYINSMIDNRGSLPRGELKRALRRFPRQEYAHLVWQSARKGVVKALRYEFKKRITRLRTGLRVAASVPSTPGQL